MFVRLTSAVNHSQLRPTQRLVFGALGIIPCISHNPIYLGRAVLVLLDKNLSTISTPESP